MKISEIRTKDNGAILEEVKALESSRLDMAFRAVTEENQSQQINRIRKDIARYYTILREREIEGRHV
ncbi:MAG: 50S ribosomal protein L29 [Planctomycetes bacterium]|nr:50S ribosomal protein L29 [Planctomycetota bacterium]